MDATRPIGMAIPAKMPLDTARTEKMNAYKPPRELSSTAPT